MCEWLKHAVPVVLPFLMLNAPRQELDQRALDMVRGTDTLERIDEELYNDFETPAAKKVCMAGSTRMHASESHGPKNCL